MIKNRALGDSLMGLASLQFLKQNIPDLHITYALPTWITPLYQNCQGAFDEILPLSFKSLKDWSKTYRQLQRCRFDRMYELHQAGRSAKFFKAYSLIKRIPYGFHNHNWQHPTSIFDQGVVKPSIQRDLDGVLSVFKEWKLISLKQEGNFLDYTPKLSVKQSPDQEHIVLGTVATRWTKIWPLNYFFQLIHLIHEEFPQKKIFLPLGPTSLDKAIETYFSQQKLPPQVEVIKVSLGDLPQLFARCQLYIGNDTGMKHLAVALGLKTLTFFGPEDPFEWHPYEEQDHPFLFTPNLECRTETGHYCALTHCDSMICLNQFSPSQVWSKARELIHS